MKEVPRHLAPNLALLPPSGVDPVRLISRMSFLLKLELGLMLIYLRPLFGLVCLHICSTNNIIVVNRYLNRRKGGAKTNAPANRKTFSSNSEYGGHFR